MKRNSIGDWLASRGDARIDLNRGDVISLVVAAVERASVALRDSPLITLSVRNNSVFRLSQSPVVNAISYVTFSSPYVYGVCVKA